VTKSRVYLLGGGSSSTVYQAPFSGGLNDYMGLSGISPTDPTNFNLPDTTLTDINGIYSFIKT